MLLLISITLGQNSRMFGHSTHKSLKLLHKKFNVTVALKPDIIVGEHQIALFIIELTLFRIKIQLIFNISGLVSKPSRQIPEE